MFSKPATLTLTAEPDALEPVRGKVKLYLSLNGTAENGKLAVLL